MQEFLIIYACITALVWVVGGLIVYTLRDLPGVSEAVDGLRETVRRGQDKYKKRFGRVVGLFLFDLLILGTIVFWPLIIFKKN